ncbi:hypothetical protein K0F31_13790 [Bacteroides thetaiotaomicron]|jgi:hypothetical protein|nr:hypothetical protein [Bacteroides thetaiotaomicron]
MKCLIYLFIILLASAICLSSCRTQYIPVETVRTEYKTRDSVRYDSIYKHDSIFYLIKGDTVYKYVKQVEYKYLFINRTDTILKTDSIQVPYPVEKRLTRWQTLKMELGGWALGVIIVFALVIVGRMIYRLRKK